MSDKPNIRTAGNKVKVNTALQSLDDKLRIANKVSQTKVKVDPALQSLDRLVR